MLRETIGADLISQYLPQGFSPEVVLSLVATTSNEARPSGTAVMISPHFALTATHVIDDYFEMVSDPASQLSILGRSGFVPKHQNRSWNFNQVVRNNESDIALLVLANEPPIIGINYPRVNLIPPEIGEIILAMGFHSSTTVDRSDNAGPLRIWADNPTISRGVVLEVHQQARDKLLMPLPCFVADCDVRGGMSGGPVFDRDGRLRGIISRAMAPIDDDSHATTAQSVWSSLTLPINKTRLWRDLDYGETIYEAILRGRILADGIQRIAPVFKPDGCLEKLSLMKE